MGSVWVQGANLIIGGGGGGGRGEGCLAKCCESGWGVHVGEGVDRGWGMDGPGGRGLGGGAVLEVRFLWEEGNCGLPGGSVGGE